MPQLSPANMTDTNSLDNNLPTINIINTSPDEIQRKIHRGKSNKVSNIHLEML